MIFNTHHQLINHISLITIAHIMCNLIIYTGGLLRVGRGRQALHLPA